MKRKRRSWREAAELWYQQLSPLERHKLELEREANDAEVKEDLKLRAKLLLVILVINLCILACPDAAWF